MADEGKKKEPPMTFARKFEFCSDLGRLEQAGNLAGVEAGAHFVWKLAAFG